MCHLVKYYCCLTLQVRKMSGNSQVSSHEIKLSSNKPIVDADQQIITAFYTRRTMTFFLYVAQQYIYRHAIVA